MMGVYSSRAALAASWAAWVMASGVGRGVRCLGAGGAWVPVVRGGGLSAVQRGRVRLLCMVPGPWGGSLLRLPGLLAALPGVVRGRDRVGWRSSCCRGPVPVRVSSPTA